MENTKVEINKLGRKTVDYHPSIWDDFFINHIPPSFNMSQDLCIIEKAEKLKKSIRTLINATNDAAEIMNLIDAIQHLGIDYHFQSEIDDKLQFLQSMQFESNDLHLVALRFRLLRQHGLYVSPDEFSKFKNVMGNFKATLIEDTKGLLSLYNAAHLLLPNECILEEAIKFTRDSLKNALHNMKPSWAKQVMRALKSPLPRMMKRIEARLYIDEYEEEDDRNEMILEFAKLDFTVVQTEHCKELKALTLWWKDLNPKENLPYCRDRLIECYFWILGVYFEPCYSRARIITTKVIFLLSILDDTYDVYATLEECRLLTLAIQRWDEGAADLLADQYLKRYYLKVLNTAMEVESELQPSEKFRMSYFKDVFKLMAEAYLQESEWYAQDYIPSDDERKEHSVSKSSGYPAVCCISFVGMGEVATKDAFEWVMSIPKVVRASSEIARFTDDILGYEREHNLGQVASTLDCCMKQYNETKEETITRFYSWIEEAWKIMNQERLKSNNISWTLQERVVNFAKSIQTLYTHCDDGYNKNENVKDFIELLFIKPLSF